MSTSPEKEALIIHLLREGKPVEAIARQTKVCATAIYRINRKHGVRQTRPKRKVGNFALGITGKLLSELEAKYTVAELVVKLGFSQTSIVRWRSNRGNITLFQVEALANLAGYDLTLVPKEPRK